jgi:hypothetical protein
MASSAHTMHDSNGGDPKLVNTTTGKTGAEEYNNTSIQACEAPAL